jgi:hypothetical protein
VVHLNSHALKMAYISAFETSALKTSDALVSHSWEYSSGERTPNIPIRSRNLLSNIHFYRILTELPGVAVDLYSRVTRFQTRQGYRIPCLTFPWFSSVPQGKYQNSTSVKIRLSSSRSFLIHHSPIILPFNATYFRYFESHKSNHLFVTKWTKKSAWILVSVSDNLLLVLASRVMLSSESRGTHDCILFRDLEFSDASIFAKNRLILLIFFLRNTSKGKIKSFVPRDIIPYSPVLSQLTFWRNMPPPSSMLKKKRTRYQHEAGNMQNISLAESSRSYGKQEGPERQVRRSHWFAHRAEWTYRTQGKSKYCLILIYLVYSSSQKM